MRSFSIYRFIPFVFLVVLSATIIRANAPSPYPLRGLCIEAPSPQVLDEFVDFINDELAPAGINTLIICVDFQYYYQFSPELIRINPFPENTIRRLFTGCRYLQ